MKKLVGLIFILSLSGCAGAFAPPKRWVKDNIFHSTKTPRISIKVDKSMIYHPTEIENSLTTSAEYGFHAGMATEWFKFRDKSGQKALNIKIETLGYTNRIYMARPDYSEWKDVVISDTEKINNEIFATGILAVYDKYTLLLKAYGRNIGDTIRYQIYYLEKVNSDWSKKNPKYLSKEDQNFLAEFNERASASFSIESYREQLSSELRSTQTPHQDSQDKDSLFRLSPSQTEVGEKSFTKSFVVAEIKNSDFESGLINKYPELALCFSMTETGAIKMISSIKDQVVNDASRGLPEVLSAKEVSAIENSTYTGTFSRYIRKNIARFSTDYLPSLDKKRCKDFYENNKIDLSTGAPFTDPTTGMEFIYIKGGCYQMGDTFGDGYSNEKPVHEVCVDDFYLGKYEVTQGEYKLITGSNPSRFKKGNEYPVEKISWNQAQDFITKLNGHSDKTFRLPTEAEWEYAARSGGKKEKYSGSNSPDSGAWYGGNSSKSTHRVGTKSSNGLGLYDMSGNVWEWCSDWYKKDYYSSSARNNPQGPLSGSSRVYRGGSWFYSPLNVRSAVRFKYEHGNRHRLEGLGLRLVFPVAANQ